MNARNGLCADIFTADNHLHWLSCTIRFLFLFAFLSSPILKSSFPDRAGERRNVPALPIRHNQSPLFNLPAML